MTSSPAPAGNELSAESDARDPGRDTAPRCRSASSAAGPDAPAASVSDVGTLTWRWPAGMGPLAPVVPLASAVVEEVLPVRAPPAGGCWNPCRLRPDWIRVMAENQLTVCCGVDVKVCVRERVWLGVHSRERRACPRVATPRSQALRELTVSCWVYAKARVCVCV